MRESQHQTRGHRLKRSAYDTGFTLIEVLIVIVVLGILAATVIFALGTATNQSAQAACNSDAKSVEIAVQAFHNNSQNTAAAGQYPASQAELTDPSSSNYGGPYLNAWPNSTHYTISLDATPGQVDVNGHSYDGTPNPCLAIS